MDQARAELVKLTALSRLATAITSGVSEAANLDLKIEAETLIFREKPLAKWTGLFTVTEK